MSEKTCIGKVYLVGAGVNKIDYLTIRAKELLTKSQILIYDALIDKSLLNLAPPDCLKLDVGKRGGRLSTSQETINQLLIAYCSQGKQVIRLKSGDPLIFGRANEEIFALQEANCPFEIVPGISSAFAAPLLAGISLTDKDLSKCFAVLTAHETESLDWQALAKIDTLIILMGARNLHVIIENLQTHGRSPNEAIGIIRDAGSQQQQIWRGTLTDIVDQTMGISLSPAVIVIGKVVKMSNFTVDTTHQPLQNKTILVTRAAEQSSTFTDLLQAQGATVIEMSALEIRPPSSWQALDNAIAHLGDFDWLILTSANAVDYFFQRLSKSGKDARALANLKIAVVGKKTAAILNQYNLQPDFIPPNYVADSLVANFPETLSHLQILFPRVETGGRDILVKELTNQGAQVLEVAAYESGCPKEIDTFPWEALQNKKIDIITFASSKTVKNFYDLVKSVLIDNSKITSLLEKVLIASIGPQTSKTCQEIFGRVDIEAQEYTLEGLTEAIIKITK